MDRTLAVREFLYLNDDLVNQFLAQAEGGLYDEEAERERAAGDRHGDISLKVGPAVAGGSRRSGVDSEVSRTRRQTPESRFNRLALLLPELPEKEYLYFEPGGGNLYSLATPGRLLTTECYVDTPSVGRLLAQSEQLSGLADLMRMFNADGVDAKTEEALSGFSALSNIVGSDVICTGEIDDDLPVLVFKLLKKFLRADLGALEGEAIILGNIHRKWPEGQRYPLITVPGLDLMSRADRRRLQATTKSDDSNDMTIDGPGLTLSVVAVYRGSV
jgi:hypothetical protein